MKFEPNNQISYIQDFRFYKNIPAGVDFTVTKVSYGHYKLKADGYGNINHYGCGPLSVIDLTKEQIELFDEHCQPRSEV